MKYLSSEQVNDLPLMAKEKRAIQMAAIADIELNLSKQYNSEVKSCTFTDSEGNVKAAYFKSPHRMHRPDILNFIMKQEIGNAGALIYKSCLLEKESDKEITDDDNCYDAIVVDLGLSYNFERVDKKK
jgi:hypothetical protein